MIRDGFRLAVLVGDDQFREHVGDFFRDEAVLNGFVTVGVGLFVAKLDRAQLQQPRARIGHWLDVFLVAAGRGNGSELAVSVDHHGGARQTSDSTGDTCNIRR